MAINYCSILRGTLNREYTNTKQWIKSRYKIKTEALLLNSVGPLNFRVLILKYCAYFNWYAEAPAGFKIPK